jgi:two-component system, cell cycle sensor histidine kinase and response regulator CckA
VAGGTETVLLCEDEAALRALLERMLGRAGYQVAAAVDAAHALELAEGIGGAYGARPLLLISGFNAETVDRRSNMPAGSAFLEKPFESADLLAAVRSLLDATR